MKGLGQVVRLSRPRFPKKPITSKHFIDDFKMRAILTCKLQFAFENWIKRIGETIQQVS